MILAVKIGNNRPESVVADQYGLSGAVAIAKYKELLMSRNNLIQTEVDVVYDGTLAACYQDGDVVQALPDDHVFSVKERKCFLLIKIDGKPDGLLHKDKTILDPVKHQPVILHRSVRQFAYWLQGLDVADLARVRDKDQEFQPFLASRFQKTDLVEL